MFRIWKSEIRNFIEGWQINKIAEKEIVKIWQRQLLPKDGMVTADGEPLRIIYPGRLNDDRGADFREAVIVTGEKLQRGDVEIHIHSAGWQEHKHDRDAFYNSVILHVVMWQTGSSMTLLQNGTLVPILALENYIDVPEAHRSIAAAASSGSTLSCFHAALSHEKSGLGELLDIAGDQRFTAKADSFRKGLGVTAAGQLLYQEVMGALGYSKNKLSFLELARLLPLRYLESVTPDDASEAVWLMQRQALLLETSGLPFTQARDSYSGMDLISKYPDWPDKSEMFVSRPRPMSPASWHLLRIRPNNSPVLRLAAMSRLLLRYRKSGLVEGLAGLVREAPVSRKGCKILEAGLVVKAENSGTGLTLLGNGRAADIVINVLLPFAFAWSGPASEPELGVKALGLYHLYPRLTLNSIEKHMSGQLGLDAAVVNSARRQQGLIQIYNQLCTMGRCGQCPLAHSEELAARRT